MPGWLRPLALANPLTGLVDALRVSSRKEGAEYRELTLRTQILRGETGLFPLSDGFTALIGVPVALTLIESRLYPRMAR
ncbi:MAG: hypothetical protein ACRECT_08775 [Thermoplasmata archaeon]